MRPIWPVISVFVLGAAAGASGVLAAEGPPDEAPPQQAMLAARSVLPSATFRAGSPPSGAFLSAADRATAAGNGLPTTPVRTPLFTEQPVQGVSAVVPAGGGQWWVLTDNGFGARDNSADWQLALHRMDLGLGSTGTPRVLETVLLSDPSDLVPWKTVCDPVGADLPPFNFNVLPATRPAACGTDPAARLLTGFDFDTESLQVDRAGTFWIGDEFGPFLLHADRQGRLLEAPIPVPGVTSPQNPTLDVAAGQRPTVAGSRGLESLAIDPTRRHLYAMPEGAVGEDDPQDLRILEFDLRTHRFTGRVARLRLEMPGAKVNLAGLTLVGGARAYPGTTPPVGTGGESAAELTAVNSHQFLVVERDSNGDGLPAPRFKKIFLLDTDHHGPGDRTGPDGPADEPAGHLDKTLLVDLMAVPDPRKLGGDGDFFRFPFNTIESVHVVGPATLLTANDNNYPFSNARSRSRTNERTGPLAPDDNEFIEIRLGQRLDVDARLLSP